MKKIFVLLLILSSIKFIFNTESNRIPSNPDIVLEGAASVQGQFDIPNSKYFNSLDFYNMKSEGSLILLENFKTFQQTTEVTCGPATIIMLLSHFGKFDNHCDRALYELRENKEKPETYLKEMIDIINSTGDWDIFSTFDLEDPSLVPKELIINTLKDGVPIIFGDDDWGGHWRIIIGYDDLGDDIDANDVLIVAEPYDTTDHKQDGYTVIPFERLYYNWSNRFDPDFSHRLLIIAKPK